MRSTMRVMAPFALASAILAHPMGSFAGPADYVFTPTVEEGEREIDFKGGTANLRDGTRESQYSLGLGWGATSWWFTEFYAIWHQEPGQQHDFDAWEWENKFQLTETGRYPVDVGFVIEIERPKDRSEGYEYRWGPLFQADLASNVQANLNLLFEKHVRTTEGAPAEMGYQWQLKHRWRPAFEYGLQGFGGMGPWDHWERNSEQSHIAGPAIFGRVKVGDRQTVTYNAGLLVGLTHESPRHTLRVQAEYEF